MYLSNLMLRRRCKWWKHCKLYDYLSDYCTVTGGDYDSNPFDFKPVDCYRLFEEQGKNCKHWIDKTNK